LVGIVTKVIFDPETWPPHPQFDAIYEVLGRIVRPHAGERRTDSDLVLNCDP